MDPSMSLLIASRKQFYDIVERFSETEKAAYVEAAAKCPDLIQAESNPDHYLESANFDAFSAARRVLEYWALRRSWFGPDRAFLPMDITGDGAMSKEDIEVLHTGFMMLLPEDNFGRGVVFHDRARLTSPEVMDVDKRKRGIFYVLSVAGESAQVRKNGLVFLSAFCDKTRKSTFDLQMLSDKVSLMKKEVLPYRFVGMHLVMLSQRPILNMVVPMTLQAFEKMNCLKRGIVVHSRKPADQLLEEFKRHGFDPESIPKVPFGGFWTLGCFRRWMEERLLKERKAHDPKPAALSSSAASSFAAEEAAGGAPTSGSVEGEEHHETEEEYGEQLRKKRKMGAAYARRKRARNKIEVEVMQNEVERLNAQKEAFENEGAKLEALLAEARAMSERIESDPELLAQATAVPAPVDHSALQGSAVPSYNPASNSSLGGSQDMTAGGGRQADQQNDFRFLRQFMNSFTQPDLTSHFPMSAPFQPIQQAAPAAAPSAQQLLLSLLAGNGSFMNQGNAYANNGNGNNMGMQQQQQQQQFNQNQENLLRSLCVSMNNGAYSDPSRPPARA
jgi:hypothetical protein